HQYTIRILNGKRDGLVQHLSENNVPCGVYYPIPLHKQKAYLDERYKEEDFEVTNQLVDEVLSLPMHTELDDAQIDFITGLVNDFVNS
ncbi:MAG: DegT/DnrJ/EryC1/StrS family aminotransferase, partial [Bacteroidota bacterium]